MSMVNTSSDSCISLFMWSIYIPMHIRSILFLWFCFFLASLLNMFMDLHLCCLHFVYTCLFIQVQIETFLPHIYAHLWLDHIYLCTLKEHFYILIMVWTDLWQELLEDCLSHTEPEVQVQFLHFLLAQTSSFCFRTVFLNRRMLIVNFWSG